MMKIGIVAMLIGAPAIVFAQWPLFPAAGAPKLANGRVDTKGPAPKTADGKPDLSGVWLSVDRPGGPGGGPGSPSNFVTPGFGAACFPASKGATDNRTTAIPRGGFQNLAALMPGCLLPFQPWALELHNKRLAENAKDNPDAWCLPLNPVWLWLHPDPRKLIQNPREIVMLAEANSGVRQIFTDGRPLPNKDSVQPWWYGYSVGRWEGSTLVVESTGFKDDTWIDEDGSPMTSQARVTERIRRPDYGTLEVEITVNDPKAYTRPFTISANQYLMPDDELMEFICNENNTSVKHLVGDK